MPCAATPAGTGSSRASAATRRSRAFAARSARSSGRSAGSSSIHTTSITGRSGSTFGSCSRLFAQSCSIAMPTDRVNFLDLLFDRLTIRQVKDRLRAVGASARYAYLVTPNVDHLVRIDREPALRTIYDDADLCLCDSRVLRLLARMCGIRLTLVPGSDLTAQLFDEVVQAGNRVAIVGGTAPAVERLRIKFPDVEFVHHEPPMGLRSNPVARRSAAEFIATAHPRFAL